MKTSKKLGYLNGQSFAFNVIGDCIVKHRSIFKLKVNAMRRLFASIIEVDARCVELNLCVKVHGGLQFGFTVYQISNYDHDDDQSGSNINNKEKNSNGRYLTLLQLYDASYADEKHFIDVIIEIWDINKMDNNNNNNSVTREDIKITDMLTFYHTSIDDEFEMNEYKRDLINVKQLQFYQKNLTLFLFEKLGVYRTICILSGSTTTIGTTDVVSTELFASGHSSEVVDNIGIGNESKTDMNMDNFQVKLQLASELEDKHEIMVMCDDNTDEKDDKNDINHEHVQTEMVNVIAAIELAKSDNDTNVLSAFGKIGVPMRIMTEAKSYGDFMEMKQLNSQSDEFERQSLKGNTDFAPRKFGSRVRNV